MLLWQRRDATSSAATSKANKSVFFGKGPFDYNNRPRHCGILSKEKAKNGGYPATARRPPPPHRADRPQVRRGASRPCAGTPLGRSYLALLHRGADERLGGANLLWRALRDGEAVGAPPPPRQRGYRRPRPAPAGSP